MIKRMIKWFLCTFTSVHTQMKHWPDNVYIDPDTGRKWEKLGG